MHLNEHSTNLFVMNSILGKIITKWIYVSASSKVYRDYSENKKIISSTETQEGSVSNKNIMFHTVINNNNNSIQLYGLFQNVRSLRTKLDVLRQNEALFTLDLNVFAETYLNDDYYLAEMDSSNSNIYRCDRDYLNCGVSRGLESLFVKIINLFPNV